MIQRVSIPPLATTETEKNALDRPTEAFLRAKRRVDRSREHMMDKHNEIVDKSQKKLVELIQKKNLEKEIQQAQDMRETLNAEALSERLKQRKLYEL